jgi:hypothetical protein
MHEVWLTTSTSGPYWTWEMKRAQMFHRHEAIRVLKERSDARLFTEKEFKNMLSKKITDAVFKDIE